MMKKNILFVSLLIVLMVLAACTNAEEASSDTTLLTVEGKEYSLADLEALGSATADYTNKDGETTTYSGVPLVALLEDSGATGDNVTFTAADGYEAELSLEEALACSACIVAIDEGSLRTVMPDMSSKLQVKDVVDIDVE
jgi:hypothetical protein